VSQETGTSPWGLPWQAAALDAMDVGVVLLVEGEVARSNTAGARLLRLDAQVMTGRTLGSEQFLVFDEDGVPVAAEDFVAARVLARRVPVERVIELRWPDGASRLLLASGVPVSYEGRNAAVVTYRDVTKERQAQRAVEVSKRRLQEIVDVVDASVFVKDRDGRYTFVNEVFLQNLGLTREQVLGRRTPDLADAGDEAQVAAAATATRQDAELFRTGQPVSDPLTNASGRVYLTTKTPLWGADGEVSALAGVSTDITEQVRAAEAQATAAAVVDSSTDGIVIFDCDLRVTGINATALHRTPAPAQTLIGRPYPETFPEGEGRDRTTALLRRVVDDGEQVELDWEPEEGPAAGLSFAVRGFPIRSVDGAIIGGALLGRDVTDIRLAENRRQELERQVHHMERLEGLGQLAGGIAHDFNNLLAALNLTTEMLRSDLPAGSEGHAQATRIIEIAASAAALTAQLLVFARRDEPSPARVDLNAVVRRIDDLLDRTLGEHVHRHLELADQECFVEVDPSRLEQVVLNLAVNARDAMPDGGELRIATTVVDLGVEDHESFYTRSPGPHVVLEVTDEGRGMPPGAQARAFDPFFTTKPRGHGTGLGLATVYGVATQAGGGTWLYSEPGRGTVVKVALPLVGSPEPGDPAAPRRSPQHGGGTRVAVVEDEEALRTVARRLLERAGYVVQTYASGSDFLTALAAGDSPALLVSDVVLPGLSGPETVEQARQLRPGLRVVFMSGYTAGLMGGHDVAGELLPKPFTAATLLESVERALAGSPLP
jgi:two-component system, cell cycle sensor histidine kinase and response regulator CckA